MNLPTTESRNPSSESIDALSPLEFVRLMNREDARVAEAVGREAESIALAVEVIADRLRRGGRLVYFGAGTSGRLGVLDASECPPTFNTPPELVVGLIAGGYTALTRAVEGAEDHPEFAVDDLQRIGLTANDVVVGIASSGRTPYVIGGLDYARSLGAFAIGLACTEGAALAASADLMIAAVVGPELITGSTRLKAGTATKLVLNMLTTGAMVQLGKTYGNLMVDLRATNTKLVARTRRIVAVLTGLTESEAEDRLRECAGELKTAVVVVRRQVTPDVARKLLASAGGRLRAAAGVHTVKPSPLETPSSHSDDLVIGVDGGGTKTVAWLASLNGGPDALSLGRGEAGPGNPRAAGFETAQANIDAAIAAAFADSGLPRRIVAAACFGLSGAGRAEEQDRIRRWAETAAIARRVRVTHDAETILATASGDATGVALIAGTGSLAWGRNRDGRTDRTGGWGYLLGDEGGGYWIALAGLRAALCAADGRGQPTHLLPHLLTALQLTDPSELIGCVYRPELSREQLAQLSRVVFDAAATDGVAAEIVAAAADELARMTATLAHKLGLVARDYTLALTGSVLVHQERLRDLLMESLRDAGAEPGRLQIVTNPVTGAVSLARQLVAE